MNFKVFQLAMNKHFNKLMKEDHLFVVNIEPDAIWDQYLKSFDTEDNPIFRERTEHDCSTCRQFVKRAGGIVKINKDLSVTTIWDIKCSEEGYQKVADRMSAFIKKAAVEMVFVTSEKNFGVESNRETIDGIVHQWNHLYGVVPQKHFIHNPSLVLGKCRDDWFVLLRSVSEISLDAAETVLELIDQKSIYRGNEHKHIVEFFIKTKKEFDKIKNSNKKKNFIWLTAIENPSMARVRNTVIGTLLADISDGVELDRAVAAFESKVAPVNYKRTTAVVTPKMIKNAQKKVEELGLRDALDRRFATESDITINNVLFMDRTSKKSLDVFDDLVEEASASPKKVSKKVDMVSFNDFIEKVLPTAETVELLFENSHKNRLMSLVAPVYDDAPLLFKWPNNFSWAYNGDVTDTIKERVKAAGGDVEGYMRASLSWYNYDDLDIHCKTPSGEIYFGTRGRTVGGGRLDVDMNAGGRNTRSPVENIIWKDRSDVKPGKYKIWVNNYSKRETIDTGFEVQFEFNGSVTTFSSQKSPDNGKNIDVIVFEITKTGELKVIKSLDGVGVSTEMWGVKTNTFQKVKMAMLSPIRTWVL